MAIDPSTVQWDDAPKSSIDPKSVKWDDEAKLGESFTPIGDTAPDFGSAKMRPGEIDNAGHTIGMAIAPNATERLESLPPLTGADAKNEMLQAIMGPLGGSDLARTAGSKLIPAAPVASGLAGLFTGLGNELVPAFGGTPDKSPADAATEMAQRLSYEPQTPGGKALGAMIDAPFEALGTAGSALGSKVQDNTGSPLLATAADTAVQALPFLFGGERAMKATEPTAPPAPFFKAAESETAANPQPSPTDMLKQVTDAVDAKIKEATQPPPVPNPVTPAAPPVQVERAATPMEVPNGPAARTPADLREQGSGGNGTGVVDTQNPAPAPVAEPAAPRVAAPEVPVAENDKPVAQPAQESTAIAAPSTASSELAVKPVEQNVSQPGTPKSLREQSDARQQRIDQLNTQRKAAPLSEAENAELHDLNEKQAGTNPLSGLPNKNAFKRDMASGDYSHAVAIDVDEFKKINDSLGHGVGDLMLQHLAEDLGAKSTDDLKFYHLSGDEYAAAAKGDPTARMEAISSELDNKPITLREVDSAGNKVDHQFQGVGITHGVGEGPDAYARADVAANAAKEARRQSGTIERRREGDQPQQAPRRLISSTRDEPLGSGDRGRQEAPAHEQVAPDVAVAERPEPKPAVAEAPPQKPAEVTTPEPRDTSVRNAATAVDRATHGLDDLPEAERKGWDKSKAEAADAMAKDPAYARNLAREVLQSKRGLSDSETMALGAERQRLQDAYHAADDAILKARESGDADAEVRAEIAKQSALEELDTNHRATKAGGTELARAMAARNAQMLEDYSPARTMTRAKVAYGDKFDPKIEQQVKDLTAKLAEQDKRIQELEGKASKAKLDANAKEQARLQKSIDEMEAKLAKRLKVCPL